jgi:transposase-like protein
MRQSSRMNHNTPFLTPEELTLPEIMARFSTEEKAIEYMESILWQNGPVCPHCGNANAEKIWKLTANKEKKIRVGLRQCAECKKSFRVTVGTIFEDSHIPLNLWLVAWYLLSGAKKGISAKQMQRHLGLGSYKSAWHLCHRIREVLQSPVVTGDKLSGMVEVDECYYGPKTKGKGFRRGSKSAVVALVERQTGKRRSVVLSEIVTGKNLREAVQEHVAAGATIHTDEHPGYKKLGDDGYRHKFVTHGQSGGKREYQRIEADGEIVSTNYAESSFSLLRRGVIGNFHHISRKHLGRYVAEFDFRWNSRKETDGERTVSGLEKAKGKRLTMKQLVGL